MRAPRILLAALLALLVAAQAAPAGGGGGSSFRILVVYAGTEQDSVMWRDVVTWIYGTVWRLPVDWFDASERGNDTWLTANLERYSLVFLLEAPLGISRLSEDAWREIYRLDGRTAYVVFGLAPNDPHYARLLGATYASRVSASKASVSGELRRAGLPGELGLHGHALVVKPGGPSGSAAAVLASAGGGAVAVRRGNNVWLGFEELYRGEFPWNPWLFPLARYLLSLPGRPAAILVMPERFVALRIDDFPFSTESWYFHWQYFTPEGYERFYETLARHGAKVSYAVIPFNVSKKTGAWVSYDRIFPRRVALAVEWERRGVVELLDHGATHVTPYQEFYMKAPLGDPYVLTRSIVYEFGYEPHLRRRIPYGLQLAHLKAGIGEIERWSGRRVEGFVPPWHVWDRDTERALAALGVWFISADFRFTTSLGRPRSAPGMTTPYGQVYAPATHSWGFAVEASEDSLRGTIGAFLDNGVPVVLLSHGRNWSFHGYTETFTVRQVDETLSKLERAVEPRFASVGEVAAALRAWSRLEVEEEWNGTGLVLRIRAVEPVKLRVEPVGFEAGKVYLDGAPVSGAVEVSGGSHVVYVEAGGRGGGLADREWLEAAAAVGGVILVFAVLTLFSRRASRSRGGGRRSR